MRSIGHARFVFYSGASRSLGGPTWPRERRPRRLSSPPTHLIDYGDGYTTNAMSGDVSEFMDHTNDDIYTPDPLAQPMGMGHYESPGRDGSSEESEEEITPIELSMTPPPGAIPRLLQRRPSATLSAVPRLPQQVTLIDEGEHPVPIGSSSLNESHFEATPIIPEETYMLSPYGRQGTCPREGTGPRETQDITYVPPGFSEGTYALPHDSITGHAQRTFSLHTPVGRTFIAPPTGATFTMPGRREETYSAPPPRVHVPPTAGPLESTFAFERPGEMPCPATSAMSGGRDSTYRVTPSTSPFTNGQRNTSTPIPGTYRLPFRALNASDPSPPGRTTVSARGSPAGESTFTVPGPPRSIVQPFNYRSANLTYPLGGGNIPYQRSPEAATFTLASEDEESSAPLEATYTMPSSSPSSLPDEDRDTTLDYTEYTLRGSDAALQPSNDPGREDDEAEYTYTIHDSSDEFEETYTVEPPASYSSPEPASGWHPSSPSELQSTTPTSRRASDIWSDVSGDISDRPMSPNSYRIFRDNLRRLSVEGPTGVEVLLPQCGPLSEEQIAMLCELAKLYCKDSPDESVSNMLRNMMEKIDKISDSTCSCPWSGKGGGGNHRSKGRLKWDIHEYFGFRQLWSDWPGDDHLSSRNKTPLVSKPYQEIQFHVSENYSWSNAGFASPKISSEMDFTCEGTPRDSDRLERNCVERLSNRHQPKDYTPPDCCCDEFNLYSGPCDRRCEPTGSHPKCPSGREADNEPADCPPADCCCEQFQKYSDNCEDDGDAVSVTSKGSCPEGVSNRHMPKQYTPPECCCNEFGQFSDAPHEFTVSSPPALPGTPPAPISRRPSPRDCTPDALEGSFINPPPCPGLPAPTKRPLQQERTSYDGGGSYVRTSPGPCSQQTFGETRYEFDR
ncbi:hypothetical protein AAG570_008992 [Ranatra chinensis]|uniref:Uncharacterized protein n=1 Tax=Ranatra chinensis TaxID=642074 RepID=A0ABD0YSI9_9HEMI